MFFFNLLSISHRKHRVSKENEQIDTSETQMNTISEILNNANSIKNSLNLISMVVIMGQAIYGKAIKISWMHHKLFQNLVLKLETLDTIGVFLVVTDQSFGAARLRNITESKVITERSVKKNLNGKHYNRAVRFHKLMFEACIRLIWESFFNWMSQSEINNVTVNQTLNKINKLNDQKEVNETLLESVCSDQAVAGLLESFQDFYQLLCESNGTLSRFWMGYIDPVTILLNLICVSREGNWPLHLSSI